MKSKRTVIFFAALSTAVVLSALCFTHVFEQTVKAFNPQPDPPAFGLLGLVSNETLQLNAVNTAEVRSTDVPPGPCHVVMEFKDVMGNVLTRRDGTPIVRTVDLAPGQSASLSLNSNMFLRDGTGRIELLPVVQIQQADPVGGVPPGPCLPSGEVIGDGGRTRFMLPAVQSLLPAVQRGGV